MSSETVSQTIHPDDEMMKFILHRKQPPEQYFRSGRKHAQMFVNYIKKFEPSFRKKRILDYGCGHGRITRYLDSMLQYSELMVSDVWVSAVDFCGKEFDAHTFVVSSENKISSIQENFDIIISYSVFSHLPPDLFEFTLSELSKILNTNGLLLFTAKGDFHIKKLNLPMEKGYHFGSVSDTENHTEGRISKDQYSLMVVTESYVKDLLNKTGFELLEHVSSSNLPSRQDLYVTRKVS